MWQSYSHKALLQDDLSNATEVNSSHVAQGSLHEVSFPYQNETITVQLINRDCVTVFGLRVSDAAGNTSPMSNIVSVKPISTMQTSILATNGSVYRNATSTKIATNVTTPLISSSTVTISHTTTKTASKTTARPSRTRPTRTKPTEHTQHTTRPMAHHTSPKPTTSTLSSKPPKNSQLTILWTTIDAPQMPQTAMQTTTETSQSLPPCTCPPGRSTAEIPLLQGLTHSQLILIVSATVPVVVVVIVMIFILIAIRMRGQDIVSRLNSDEKSDCPMAICEAKKQSCHCSAQECSVHRHHECCRN